MMLPDVMECLVFRFVMIAYADCKCNMTNPMESIRIFKAIPSTNIASKRYQPVTETLTVHEAAQFLRVSKTTIRRKAMDGTLPALRLGSRLRFSRETLERMLSTGNVAQQEATCTTESIEGKTARTGGHHGQMAARQLGARLGLSGMTTLVERKLRPLERP